mmetsp:Transcript_13924/g.32483  ORF Transcript_13924/g.32483 Transcript_13924/m.32483 type:complete len:242 (-) Transcript_13924:2960-3685(-)
MRVSKEQPVQSSRVEDRLSERVGRPHSIRLLYPSIAKFASRRVASCRIPFHSIRFHSIILYYIILCDIPLHESGLRDHTVQKDVVRLARSSPVTAAPNAAAATERLLAVRSGPVRRGDDRRGYRSAVVAAVASTQLLLLLLLGRRRPKGSRRPNGAVNRLVHIEGIHAPVQVKLLGRRGVGGSGRGPRPLAVVEIGVRVTVLGKGIIPVHRLVNDGLGRREFHVVGWSLDRPLGGLHRGQR